MGTTRKPIRFSAIHGIGLKHQQGVVTMSEQKSGEEKKREVLGSISRRSFLKDAGIVVSAPAIGSLALGASAQTAAQANQAAPHAAAAAPGIGTVEAAMEAIQLTVNGGKYKFTVEPNWTLRQVLRDQIGFTSVKDWCGGYGACGSCTVIMDGRPILSCMTLACQCNGARIETAEGIAKARHPIIDAYIKNNAFQCGYCTPGFVCTAKALLDRNRKPTEADVRDALGGNLCRCATYQRHPLAVLEAAQHLEEAYND
jgi:aerobic-type carbon monoxide dehydrogenase small subunit (CoxS/CutS family)